MASFTAAGCCGACTSASLPLTVNWKLMLRTGMRVTSSQVVCLSLCFSVAGWDMATLMGSWRIMSRQSLRHGLTLVRAQFLEGSVKHAQVRCSSEARD